MVVFPFPLNGWWHSPQCAEGDAQYSAGCIFGKKVGRPHHGTILRAQLCIFLGNQQH